LKTRVNLITE